MEDEFNHEWWLWQMYRLAAEYINDPTVANESKLQNLMSEFRAHQRHQALGSAAAVPMTDYRDQVLNCG